MNPFSPDQLNALVQPDRVHRSLYTDPALFELEMSRLFGRAWLLVGHDSQIAAPGDFIRTTLARQPVIVCRDAAGIIRVLFNRCTHRGSLVCHAANGNAKQFVCPYHGWTFTLDGTLRFVPAPEGYSVDPCGRDEFALVAVPRVASYRGFIFASLAADGLSLTDYLGPLHTSFDDLVDRAPEGAVEISGGVFKHAYNGNWKLVLENHIDTLHPGFVHASSVHAAREQSDIAQPSSSDVAVRQMRQNGAPPDVWEKLGLWTSANGHSFMGDYHSDDRLVAAMNNPVFARYRASLEARHGVARAKEILSVHRFNTIIYPTVSFMSQFRQLRIVHPLAVDRTVVYTYSFRMRGAPEEMFHDTIAFANVVNGTASPVLTDDLEVYERIQIALAGQLNDWVYLGRGAGTDVADSPGLMRGGTGTSEIPIRNQMSAWLAAMTAAP